LPEDRLKILKNGRRYRLALRISGKPLQSLVPPNLQRSALMKRILMIWLPFAVSCTFWSGSVKPSAQESSIIARAPKPKLTRTQGSNQYQTVRCGLRDKAGNLWFSTTAEGVYRHDGNGFTQYTVQDGLPSNTVWSIVEDKKGRVWFGTDAGLARWDGKSVRAVPIVSALGLSLLPTPSPDQAFPEQSAVWSMLEDKKGTLWIGTADGVFCFKDEVFSPFLANDKVQNADGLHLKMVDDMLEDRQGNVWFASGMPPGMEGLCRFDGTSVTRLKPGGEQWIRTVVEDRDGTLWLGTRHKGVWRYDGKAFSRFSEQPGLGMPLLVDRSGNIWFSGEEHANGFEGTTGIWRFDGTTFRNFSMKEGLGNFGVWCIVEDRDGNIWVGTRNTGLYRYDGRSFTCFSE
jgi:ligand-binding sensor domain-containing protein